MPAELGLQMWAPSTLLPLPLLSLRSFPRNEQRQLMAAAPPAPCLCELQVQKKRELVELVM